MPKVQKIRLDELLLNRDLAVSLEKAQALCLAGQVIVDGQRVDRGSVKVPMTADIRLKKNLYVSRGGEKLAGALHDLQLADALTDKVVLDVGASTGGFTDCALKHGAALVIALDVGTSQLAWSLRQHERVISLEQTHLRDFQSHQHPAANFVVADISFNSLARLASYFAEATPTHVASDYLLMVKPQYELSQEEIPNGGVVIDDSLRQKAVDQVVHAFQKLGFTFKGQANSKLSGRDGNVEIFVHLSKTPSRS